MRLLALVFAFAALLVLTVPSSAVAEETGLSRYGFAVGTFIIPMDEKQTNVTGAYGLVHSLLQRGVPVYRAVAPPDPAWKTRASPFEPIVFHGGPFLVWPSWENEVDWARVDFPDVSTDRLLDVVFQDRVLAIRDPTEIVLIKGFNEIRQEEINWGRTEEVLDDMGIPYTIVNTSTIANDPTLLFRYNLIIADCPAWNGGGMPTSTAQLLRTITHEGGNVMFTDRALQDMRQVFPGAITLAQGLADDWTGSARIRPGNTSLSQFFGERDVQVTTEKTGYVIRSVDSPNGTVLLETDSFPTTPGGPLVHRIFAAQFTWGRGSVTAFAYHPFEQPAGSRNFTSALYGNTFVHSTPFLPPSMRAIPPPIAAGAPLAPAPAPPPPPPPPSLAVPSSSIGYLFAGFATVGMSDLVRNRLMLRRRHKIAVRA